MRNKENFTAKTFTFKYDAKNYKETGKEKVIVNETPAVNGSERFCDTIYSEEKDFNENAEWIKNVQTNNTNIQEQQWSDISVEELQISVEELQTALKKVP